MNKCGNPVPGAAGQSKWGKNWALLGALPSLRESAHGCRLLQGRSVVLVSALEVETAGLVTQESGQLTWRLTLATIRTTPNTQTKTLMYF